jgi:hypothetical protein
MGLLRLDTGLSLTVTSLLITVRRRPWPRYIGRMIATSPIRVLGPVLMLVTLSACLSAPGSSTSRPIAAKESNSLVAAQRESSGPADTPRPAPSAPRSGDAPGTTLPPLTCLPIERPMAACRPCSPLIGAAPASDACSPCPPPFVEAPRPVGCPAPLPPAQQPPAANANIGFCPSFASGPRPGFVPVPGAICGSHFHPGEAIRLTASGSHGSVSWTVASNATGSFRTQLPPALCRLTPFTLTATGSSGDHSNSLAVTSAACPPRP